MPAGVRLIMDSCSSSQTELVLEGVVETGIYSHYSEAAGKIMEMPVELGQEVQAGDVLAVLNELYALEQLENTLTKKKAALAELIKGVDSEEITLAENNVALAELALLEKGTPREKIEGAKADDEALTEIQIRQAKDNLAKYTITALCDGTIISKNYLVGNVVSSGFNLVDITSEKEKHLVIYVPKEYLSRVSYGQEVVIRSSGQEYTGTIGFIHVKAQYTPKDMQTSANKNKESMKVKVNLAPDIPLKVGERAEVILR